MPTQEGVSGVYRFYSPTNFVIPPHGVILLYLRLSVIIPPGYIGRFLSLADVSNPGVYTGSHVMTPDMTGQLSVLLFNHTDNFFYGHAGDVVARLMLVRVVYPIVRQATLV